AATATQTAASPMLWMTARPSLAAISTATAERARRANVARRTSRDNSGAMPCLPPAALEQGRDRFRRLDQQPRRRTVAAGFRLDRFGERPGLQHHPSLVFHLARPTTAVGVGAVGGDDYLQPVAEAPAPRAGQHLGQRLWRVVGQSG